MTPVDQECQWQVKPWNREPSISFEWSGTPGKSKTHVRVRFCDEARIKLTEETGEAGWNEYSLEGIPEGYPKGVQMDDSLNPKFRVAALRKFYNRRIRKKLGTINGCVVGRGVELCAMSVSCLRAMGYGRRTQWKRRACQELYCLRKRHFGKVWRATKSAQERESCDERLRFLRTRRLRTRCPTTKRGKG